MEEQVLSIEQMNELKRLGIDTSKASVCRIPNDGNPYLSLGPFTSFDDEDKNFLLPIPTFTLQDILQLLPPGIHLVNFGKGFEFDFFGRSKCFSNPDILQAAFEMLKWCKQNGHI